MNKEEEFVEKFVSECIDQGITSTNAICQTALDRIAQIDVELEESNKLRIEKNNLKKVIKSFGYKTKSKNTVKIDENLLCEICEFIGANNGVTVTQIINKFNKLEDNSEVYASIKTLCDDSVILKNEDRTFSVGENWKHRPVKNAK